MARLLRRFANRSDLDRPTRLRRRLWLLGSALIIGLGLAYWFNEHRTVTWGEALNPLYWVRRWREEKRGFRRSVE